MKTKPLKGTVAYYRWAICILRDRPLSPRIKNLINHCNKRIRQIHSEMIPDRSLEAMIERMEQLAVKPQIVDLESKNRGMKYEIMFENQGKVYLTDMEGTPKLRSNDTDYVFGPIEMRSSPDSN